MITAAAPALSPVQASVTSMPGQRGTARSAATATCGYATKVTIYNCRRSARDDYVGYSGRPVEVQADDC
jgi:hypothetical protein